MKKRIIAILAAGLSVVIITAFGFGLFKGNEYVLKTKNYKITERELNYYIEIEKNNYVENYTNKYGDYYLEVAGLDPEKSLKKQESCYGGTWYQYFKNEAIKNLKTKLLYCEAADQKYIKTDKNMLKQSKEKIKKIFDDIDESIIKNISQVEVLSQMYLKELKDSKKPSKDEKTKYYDDNRLVFDCVDYECITIKQNFDNDGKDLINKIVDSIEKIGFDETVKLYDIENGDLYEIREEIGYKYDDTSEFGNWAFRNERKAGDVISFNGRGISTIYHIKKTAYPYDYQIKKIQKISFNTDAEKKSLNMLYKIAEKLSENQNTTENLLLYTNEMNLNVVDVEASKEDISSNLKNWLYDSQRETGDFIILEDGYFTSFVRYCGESGSYFDKMLVDGWLELYINNNLKNLAKEINISEKS